MTPLLTRTFNVWVGALKPRNVQLVPVDLIAESTAALDRVVAHLNKVRKTLFYGDKHAPMRDLAAKIEMADVELKKS